MNQRRFFENDFFYKKFAYSASVKIRSRHSLCAEYRVLAKPNKCFEAGFVKSDSKIASWYQLALLAAVANAKIFVQKNNRPLQVELENGRSDLQNDFQIWEAR